MREPAGALQERKNHPTKLHLELRDHQLLKGKGFSFSLFLDVDFLPAAPATVVLRDAVLVLAPNIDGRENECHQHGEAAHQGKDHDALLLRLQGMRQRETLISEVWLPL